MPAVAPALVAPADIAPAPGLALPAAPALANPAPPAPAENSHHYAASNGKWTIGGLSKPDVFSLITHGGMA